MTKLPSMPWFPADFFADTQHLTPCAAHAYLFLLGHAWLRGAKLPSDDVALARLSRVRVDQWNKIKEEVKQFWELGPDGFLRNTRLTAEWGYVCEKRTRLAANGALGGRTKQLNSNGHMKPNGSIYKTMAKAPIPIPIYKDSLNGELRQEGGKTPVFVIEDTPQWNAWESYYRKSKGSTPPKTDHGAEGKGWYFPAEWPPMNEP